MGAITKFGEVITTEIEQLKYNDYNFVVNKYVNGKFRSGIPCRTHGEAIRKSNNLIKA